MARSAFNEITISDLNDGSNPITGFLTNNNHTFAADAAGNISNLAGFQSILKVFVGQTAATYNSALNGNNQFAITNIGYVRGASSGWGAPSNTNGRITIPSISTTAVTDVTIQVVFSVVPGNTLTPRTGLILDISLSIIKEGTGGSIIELAASRQSFFALSTGGINPGQSQINIAVISQGNIGTTSWSTAQDGSSFVTQANTSTGAGGIATYGTGATVPALTGAIPTTGVTSVGIVDTNLGNNLNTLTIEARGATGGLDAISVFKVKQGVAGEDSIIVNIASNDGTVFKNNAGSAKTLTASVFDSGTGTTPQGTISYNWQYANGSQVLVTSAADRTVVISGGVAANGTGFPSIIVGPEDVSTQVGFRCTVTVDS